MKQYTSNDQTAKLILLGFEKPKSEVRSEGGIFTSNARKAYSIGELIEMLAKYQDKLSMVKIEYKWFVNYHTKNIELIDALYEMILKLKEEEVI